VNLLKRSICYGFWTWGRNLSEAIPSWLCFIDHDRTGLNGHHRLWQPSRDTKHLVLSKIKQKKKQYRRKIKKAKKNKKTEEAIGEPDLDRDT
jgi:hypothetical protein